MPTFMYTLFKTPHAAVWIYCSFFSNWKRKQQTTYFKRDHWLIKSEENYKNIMKDGWGFGAFLFVCLFWYKDAANVCGEY